MWNLICVPAVSRQLLSRDRLSCSAFGRDCEYVIPFECIVNVGPDVILVNVCPEKIIVKL